MSYLSRSPAQTSNKKGRQRIVGLPDMVEEREPRSNFLCGRIGTSEESCGQSSGSPIDPAMIGTSALIEAARQGGLKVIAAPPC